MAGDNSGAAVPVIGIGASAGGLEAIREMLSVATPDVGLSFVIVQHLDPNHESLLAELLSRQTPLPVKQIDGGERVDAGHVYIIPPGHGLTIEKGRLELTEFAQPRGLRRPIDDFFESLGQDQGSNAACVILSGTGADGTSGLRAIKEHGGLCIAQDPDTARYDGMPVSAVGTGLVDFIRPPRAIIECLRSFFDRDQAGEKREDAAEIVADHADEMCGTLRQAVGHDFSGYKKSTLIRRIERRMKVLGIEKPSAYLQRIKDDSDECEALFRDLLINVTRFFRDPEMFEVLRKRVIEPLVRKTPPNGEIRVWVPGCSSGEEAYTIAVLFANALRTQVPRPMVQIFATDIDERMLAIAREGRYPLAALADIPEELRENFTIGRDGVFQMSPKVRDLVRFSSHSLVKDPPFSKLDLISCRNLLIYLGDKLQQQVFPILHYALEPDGHLFLGPSESIGRHEGMFAVVDQKSRLFRRLEGRPTYPINLPASIEQPRTRPAAPARYPETSRISWEESLSVRRIVERYAPATMVVDSDGAIVNANGRLSRYFEFPHSGSGGSYALSLARPGLREILAQLLRQAIEDRKRVLARDVTVQAEFGRQTVDVVADPLPDRTILLVFRDAGPFEPGEDDELADIGPADGEVQQLQDELRLTQHRLRNTVEELETANEELKSSNEEMMSMNEELQSTNEELTTVNDELKSKVDQLTIANADLQNFFDSTQLAVVVLDRHLNIRSFTEAATAIFPLQDTDRGRSISDVASNLKEERYIDDARAVLRGQETPTRTVAAKDGSRQWAMRVVPYRVLDGSIEGATIVLNDITEALEMEAALDDERERLELALRIARIGVWEYRIDSGQVVLEESIRNLFGIDGDEAQDVERMLNLIHPEDRPAVEASLRKAIGGETDYEASFRVVRPDGETRHLRGLGRLVDGSDPKRLIGVSFDVTPESRLAEQRELMLREMNHRVKNLFAIVASFVTGAARSATSVSELAQDIRGRIEALGRSHSLTQRAPDRTEIFLRDIVAGALEPYSERIDIQLDGPEVTIDVERLTPLALILHEWATNGVKYGALGADDGKVDVRWEKTPEDDVRMIWRESSSKISGGCVNGGDGFGSRLVEFSSRQLDAEVEIEQGEGGWSAIITIPEVRTAQTSSPDARSS